ncbi:cyanophycin synthetase [uncultured Clostridium sp.]|uniref:cyanophycin synthetase n=1 Tax=uncultured Clostridium sp. TaxID=59620 RepID=UPI002631ACFC|nr:cyanophycin synthetase [uncultured Clostridium sp.]
MKIISKRVYRGKNIYSRKKCIRVDVDLEGYAETPSKNIKGFNEKLVEYIPDLKSHRCGIDVENGFLIRLEEGTFLSHIYEHSILGLQNMLGMDVSYGKAREVSDEHYYVVFQYIYENTAIEIMNLALDIINGIIDGIKIDIQKRLEIIKNIKAYEEIGPSTKAILDGATKRGLPYFEIENSGYFQIGYGKQRKIISATISNYTGCLSSDIACDKYLTKQILEIQNIPVGKISKVRNVLELLKEAERIGYPLVLKPQYGNQGRGVILNIKEDKELLEAYKEVSKISEEVILEEFYEGKDYRICIVNGKIVAAALRTPPKITGDGVKSIEEIINETNRDKLRGDDHEKPLTKINIDNEVLWRIKERGYSLDSILIEGEELLLRGNANISTGGTAEDVTDKICKENRELFIRAAKTIGLDICGIDVCTDDISKPLKGRGIIVEINAAPGIRMHHYPSVGEKRNVGLEIVDYLYKNEVKNIPVVSITGTNGKTTTTRLISHVLRMMGNTVGMTSTEGIFINDTCIDIGDDTGYESAKSILMNGDVDVAVLETARGGMIRKGLAYDLADVAVLTNITGDHLGLDGVETEEDLAFVKSLVVEEVKEEGYSIINVDDEWSKKILHRVKGNVIFFSKDKNNKLIKEKVLSGGIAVFIDDGYISVVSNQRKYDVIKIEDVPITLNGKIQFNIENALGACAALVGLQVDYCMISKGFKSFALDSKCNAGRFNMYDVLGRTIILDYGHNQEGYKGVFSAIEKLERNRVIGVVGIAGDRTDEMGVEIGKICSDFLDITIVKEDYDRRGRSPGEMAKIIFSGIEKGCKEIYIDERDAMKRALEISEKGDLIVVFYEDREKLLEVIERYKRNKEENEEVEIKLK